MNDRIEELKQNKEMIFVLKSKIEHTIFAMV